MVHMRLIDELNRIKNSVTNPLQIAFYEYYTGVSQSQNQDIFVHEEHLGAFLGYSKEIDIDESVLTTIINKQGKISYKTNIFVFIGIHLALSGKEKALILEKFNQVDLRTQYILSTLFNLDLNIKSDSKDPYTGIITYLSDTGNYNISEVLYDFLRREIQLDVIDLVILENVQRKALNQEKLVNLSPVEVVKQALSNFNNAIKRITTDRYGKRSGIAINDEYDVQDLAYSLLKGFFNELERENPIPKFAGSSTRIDLNLPLKGILIEIKMIKKTDKNEKVSIDQLMKDIIQYSAWRELKDLVLFIYDPYNKTTDTNNFKELEGSVSYNNLTYNVHVVLINSLSD